MQHTRREHPAFAAEMLEATLGETESLYHYVRHSAQNTFGRLEWIVTGNLPLLFSKNRLARRYTNLEPISVETLRRSVEAVTHSVVRVSAEDIPERFGTIFDGCSHATEHFIAVFAWYEVNGEIRCPLLSMAPLVNEDTNDFVGRNASRLSRRDAIARLQQAAPLIVGIFAETADNDTVRETTIDDKPSTNRSANPLGSTFAMLNRFFELLPFLDVDDEDLGELLPSAVAKRRLRDLLGEMKGVESVSKALQGRDVNLLDVRVWFDCLIAKKISYSSYLGTHFCFYICNSEEWRYRNPKTTKRRELLQP
ncbi:hypothetical protein F442_05027 [Phytophthora nicotianae P10297]|uniref:Uncharacterized protein n=1 Tax=Phytophthora nicotianae P10297 TaxID=1317064 RepID=W2ZTD9_PHYNI|nr:hypothetical protein F442_05027 [Phytophthora nicotianae P10297]